MSGTGSKYSGLYGSIPSPSKPDAAPPIGIPDAEEVRPTFTPRCDRNYARWMTETEVRNALTPIDLSSDDDVPAAGIPLYSEGTVAYVDTSDAHSMVIGNTGSMKTRLFCMPMLEALARAGESAVVFDPKGELCERTYGSFKKRGYRIHVLDLRNPDRSDCWNPLYIPYQLIRHGGSKKKQKGISMLKDIAFNIVPVKDVTDPYWETSAQGLLFSLSSTLVKTADCVSEATLKNVVKLKNDVFSTNENKRSMLSNMDPNGPEYTAFSTVAVNAENTTRCILSNFDNHLWEFVCNDDLNGMLAGNDIDLASIGDSKTVVYIISPDEKKSMNAIASVFMKQLYEVLIDHANGCKDSKLPVRVNFILDEFANMPPVSDMGAIFTACRSRNMRMTVVLQGMRQLEDVYGRGADTIESNCSNIVFICGRETEYLNKLSALSGTDSRGNPLITPFGLQRMDREKREAFVLCGRHYPLITHMTDIDGYGIEPGEKYSHKSRGKCKLSVFDSGPLLIEGYLDMFD